MRNVAVLDVSSLVEGRGDRAAVAAQIDAACRGAGFFCIVGHGVDAGLCARLLALAGEFFALDEAEKAEIAMTRGGRAWRGWFPVRGELTSGVPDRKEGIYLGRELGPDDPRVAAGTPLHGPNLFPARPAGLRDTVLAYLDALASLAGALTTGVSLALGLDEDWLARHYFADPLLLLRIFHYPPASEDDRSLGTWGVGEHTDYGFLTILLQDDRGGLEVRSADGWVDVPPVPGSFVCNIGDMLDRLTGGRYRSTPHRVRATSGTGRISVPFFYDPSWDAVVEPLPTSRGLADTAPPDDATTRWDGKSVHAGTGTYGDYVLAKVAKVFPALQSEIEAGARSTERRRAVSPE